jgi:hypothetical protein
MVDRDPAVSQANRSAMFRRLQESTSQEAASATQFLVVRETLFSKGVTLLARHSFPLSFIQVAQAKKLHAGSLVQSGWSTGSPDSRAENGQIDRRQGEIGEHSSTIA